MMNFLKTKVKIHPTILLTLAILVLAQDGDSGYLEAFSAFFILFSSVFLHEIGHVTAAAWLGISTERITLHAFGGSAELDRPLNEPKEEFLISIAGPAVNLIICLVLLFFVGPGALLHDLGVRDVFVMIFFVNLAMLLFNLLPIFPMDGGRILRSLLNFVFGLYHATLAVFLLSIPLAVAVSYFLFSIESYMAIPLIFLMVAGGFYEFQTIRKKSSMEAS